jgi:hypothetical protein
MRRSPLAFAVLMTFACGPDRANDSHTGTGTTGFGTTAWTTVDWMTVGLPEAPVCVVPDPSAAPPAASGDATCVPAEPPENGIKFMGGINHVDGPCLITSIEIEDDLARYRLRCEGASGQFNYRFSLQGRAIWRALCTGDEIYVQFETLNDPDKAVWATKFRVWDAAGRLLVSYDRRPDGTGMPPFALERVDGGCPEDYNSCFKYHQRAAVQISDGVHPPVLVHDRTTRLVEFDARYVVHVTFASFASNDETDCGAEAGGEAGVEFVLADP